MNNIVKHRAYQGLKDYGVQYQNTSERAVAVGVEFPPEDVDPVLALLQAPDPVTNLPRNELTLLFANDTAPEIREYIQRYILSPIPSQGGTKDADTAIDLLRHRGESDSEYLGRLSSEITKFNESNNSEGA